MIRFFYNLLFPIGLLLFLPGYVLKLVRRGNYKAKFGERLGIYAASTRARLAQRQSIWMHAVSVGEVRVALKLAAEMKRLEPELFCILTTTTTTGMQIATKQKHDWIEVIYTPIDFWPVMRRAFAVIRPRRIVLIEAEVWPNMVALARRKGIPIALVNARLSRRSERRFQHFQSLIRSMFAALDLVCVQEREDLQRFAALGVRPERIQLTGSVKFDPVGSAIQSHDHTPTASDNGDTPRGAVLFGGSTHRGEEEILGRVLLQLRPDFPNLTLFVAPRHTERVREVCTELRALSLVVRLASELPSRSDDRYDCVVLDTTGALSSWYRCATVVFVGKSLTARGGQNPVEPILAAKPVLFGPHMENFSTLAKALVARNAAVQVADVESLSGAVAMLLQDPETRLMLVRNAQEVLAPHRGATQRTAELLRGLRVTVAAR
ncbi:MAG: 3-deoxy-D-manno-octulosonic acid transferase [Chthoniobacterales bacterium]